MTVALLLENLLGCPHSVGDIVEARVGARDTLHVCLACGATILLSGESGGWQRPRRLLALGAILPGRTDPAPALDTCLYTCAGCGLTQPSKPKSLAPALGIYGLPDGWVLRPAVLSFDAEDDLLCSLCVVRLAAAKDARGKEGGTPT